MLDSLSSSDRADLLEVYGRSVMLLDLGRCAEWVDLFEPRALVRCGGTSQQSLVQFQGREELLALGRRLILGQFDIAVGTVASPLRCRHVINNITLFGRGARCASGYGHVTVTTIGGAEPPRWLASGMYSDRLRKCPAGCWRFESRMFIPEGADVSGEITAAEMATI